MKGVILAGGTGSRLYPLTAVLNKHLLPVGPYPMIYYPISSLAKAGIWEILIISSREDVGHLASLLGSGEDLGLTFSYRVQDRPSGIAGALSLAEPFGRGEALVVILGDNVFLEDLTAPIKEYQKEGRGALIFLKEVMDPREYGVALLKDKKIIQLKEKPENPESSLCVTGIYVYDEDLFSIIQDLSPSERGELEITDVNRIYLEKGALHYHILSKWWLDTGTFKTLFEAGKYLQNIELDLFKGVRGCH